MDKLTRIIEKYCSKYYTKTLYKNPENKWFVPSNETDANYTVCSTLAGAGLLLRLIVPLWKKDSFVGSEHRFLYRKDMNFKKIKL